MSGTQPPGELAPERQPGRPLAGDRTPRPGGRLRPWSEIVRVWPAVLDKLRQTAPALAATFEGARPVGLDEEGLKIGFPAESTFNKRKAEAPDKRELMAEALEASGGSGCVRSTCCSTARRPPRGAGARSDGVDHEALVEKLKSEFDAEEVG